MSTDEPDDERESVDLSKAAEPVPDDGLGEPEPVAPAPRRLGVWQESALLFVVAIVLAIVIKALFVQAFYIPSESMEPGLQKDDRILVQKVSYWFGGSPSRGDVVVFSDPGDWLPPSEQDTSSGFRKVLSKVGLYPAGGHLVKRVIGVGGDTVTCCDDRGRIEVNGYPLDEGDYIMNGGQGLQCNGPMLPGCNWSSGVIPPGHVFVMGDNRGDSADSTVHLCQPNETDCTKNPFVDDDLVVGKVFAVVWPHDHWRWVTRPDDFKHIPDPQPTATPGTPGS